MHLKQEVEYTKCKSLSGQYLMVGISEEASYIKINSGSVDSMIKLIEKLRDNDVEEINDLLTDKEMRLFKLLDNHGYLDNNKPVIKSFNEYEKVANIIWQIKINKPFVFNIKNDNIAAYIALIVFLVCFVVMVKFASLFPINFKYDYANMSIFEGIMEICCIPILMIVLHEFGHCFMAILTGTKIDKISCGLLLIYPVVVIQYIGLPMKSTLKRVLVEIGGIMFNLIGVAIGLIIKKFFNGSIFLDTWIVLNLSIALTNISAIGTTDGYFVITAVTGFMNLRVSGYKALGSVLKKKLLLHNKKKENVMGLIILGLFIFGLLVTEMQMIYILKMFTNKLMIVAGVVIISISLLIINFIGKVYKLA